MYSSAAINTDVNGVKDLWCSSTVGCYQHRYEWGEGSCCSSTASLAAINTDMNGVKDLVALVQLVWLLSTQI